jgi:hypothetical protein
VLVPESLGHGFTSNAPTSHSVPPGHHNLPSANGCTSNAFTVSAATPIGAIAFAWARNNPAVARTPRNTSATGTIGRCWIGAPGIRVAPVFGTRVIIIAIDEVFAAIAIIANIVSALNAVVAVLVGRTLRRLFAAAAYTDAGLAVPVAGVTDRPLRIGGARTAPIAVIVGALVAVVAVLGGRAFRLHHARSAQTDTGNAIGLAGRIVRPMVPGTYAIVTTAVRAFIVVAVVADLPLP